MYSYRIEQAIRAAAVLHQDQKRKGQMPLPYVTHLYAVALLVSDYTDDESTVIAALLHDTLEDTDYTSTELEQDFGRKVREIVEAVSEPQEDDDGNRPSWEERKKAYAKKLKTAPEEALLVAAADKIHNMRSTVEQYYDNHAGFIKDFGGALDDRAMMYQDISNVLNSRLKNDIIGEFNHVYTEYKNFVLGVKSKLSSDPKRKK
mgnify:CR=1 FL=1